MDLKYVITISSYTAEMDVYRSGISLQPVTNKLLADLYMQSGDLKNAAFHYRRVLQEEPDDEG